MFFDPLYLCFAAPALLLGLWAQWRVKSAFNQWSQVRTGRGMTGAQVARFLLDSQGLQNVTVEETQGMLSDHYDPRSRTLRLSPDVFRTPSVAAAGIAAHEMGHALQHAQNYGPLAIRSAMVPTVQIGSMLGPMVFIAGLLLNFTTLAWIGVILFGAVTLFAVVTLPVEFDASKRAKELLLSQGVLVPQEREGVDKVLNAAAMTYVAGALQSLSTLMYYVFILVGGRSRD